MEKSILVKDDMSQVIKDKGNHLLCLEGKRGEIDIFFYQGVLSVF